MEHLFKFLLLAPYFYFDNWIEKANRNSKFFLIFYYFYWVYIPLYSLFSLAWTVVSVLFFNIVLRNVTDIKFWGIWFLFILLAIGLNWLTYSCFKKMFRLRRELGKSKSGRHWFILVIIFNRTKLKKTILKRRCRWWSCPLIVLIWYSYFPVFTFSAGLKRPTEIVNFSQFFTIFTGFTSPSMLFLALLGQFFQSYFSISYWEMWQTSSLGAFGYYYYLLLFPVLG